MWRSIPPLGGWGRDEYELRRHSTTQRLPFDDELGWYFLRSRHYDPSLGRFVQEDKIGRAGGVNLYAYASDPSEARDPKGTSHAYELQTYEVYRRTGDPWADNSSWYGGDSNWFDAWWAEDVAGGRHLDAAEVRALGTLCQAVDCGSILLIPADGDWAITWGQSSDFPGYIAIEMPRSELGTFAREVNGELELSRDFGRLAHEVHHAVKSQGFWGFDIAAFGSQVRRVLGADVYHYEIVEGKDFSDYGAEQQGALVGDCYGGAKLAACGVIPYTYWVRSCNG